MNLPTGSRDLVRIVLGVLLIVLLIGGALWILGPFLPALIWATMIVVATWPLLLRLQRALGGRRSLAAAVMTGLLLLIVVAPLAVAVSTIVRQAARLTDIKVAEIRIPMPPVWIEGVPVVGAKVTAEWRVYAAATPEQLASKAAPYVTPVVGWIAGRAGSFGTFLLHLLLTALLCGVLYVNAETAALGVRRFARRLQGEAGDHLVLLAAGSIRAVAVGIVGTAVIQTALGAVGVAVAGVPYVAVFAAVMFVFCIAQLGPVLPLLAAIGWLYLGDATNGGDRTVRVDGDRRFARQRHPADSDPPRRRPAAAAHHGGRDRRPDRLRAGRPVRRPGGARSRLHAAPRLDRRAGRDAGCWRGNARRHRIARHRGLVRPRHCRRIHPAVEVLGGDTGRDRRRLVPSRCAFSANGYQLVHCSGGKPTFGVDSEPKANNSICAEKMVSLTSASWNLVSNWLTRLDALRQAKDTHV